MSNGYEYGWWEKFNNTRREWVNKKPHQAKTLKWFAILVVVVAVIAITTSGS